MPFDYNSFMQGVITGLRLGRTKSGRQPPVPSDMYIITEAGQHVIAEYDQPPDVTTVQFASWYSNETYGSLRVVKRNNTTPDPTYTNAYVFFCYMPVGENWVKHVVVYSDDLASNLPYDFAFQTDVDPNVWSVHIYGSYTKVGDYYYIAISVGKDLEPTDSLLPQMTPTSLRNLIGEIGPTPMITEVR